MKLPKIQRSQDPYIAGGIGLITGSIAIFLFSYLGFFDGFGIGALRWLSPLIFMAIFVFGIYFGRFLSRFWKIFDRFARFVVTGFLSASIDFGVINLFIYFTNATSGIGFALVRSAAFFVAFFNSYFWNKVWTFDAAHSGRAKKEILHFIIVLLVGVAINVSVASVLVDVIGPKFGLSPLLWANAASVVGIAVALLWNFTGMRFVVFRDEAEHSSYGDTLSQI